MGGKEPWESRPRVRKLHGKVSNAVFAFLGKSERDQNFQHTAQSSRQTAAGPLAAGSAAAEHSLHMRHPQQGAARGCPGSKR